MVLVHVWPALKQYAVYTTFVPTVVADLNSWAKKLSPGIQPYTGSEVRLTDIAQLAKHQPFYSSTAGVGDGCVSWCYLVAEIIGRDRTKAFYDGPLRRRVLDLPYKTCCQYMSFLEVTDTWDLKFAGVPMVRAAGEQYDAGAADRMVPLSPPSEQKGLRRLHKSVLTIALDKLGRPNVFYFSPRVTGWSLGFREIGWYRMPAACRQCPPERRSPTQMKTAILHSLANGGNPTIRRRDYFEELIGFIAAQFVHLIA